MRKRAAALCWPSTVRPMNCPCTSVQICLKLVFFAPSASQSTLRCVICLKSALSTPSAAPQMRCTTYYTPQSSIVNNLDRKFVKSLKALAITSFYATSLPCVALKDSTCDSEKIFPFVSTVNVWLIAFTFSTNGAISAISPSVNLRSILNRTFV